jgi:hypothetical protein
MDVPFHWLAGSLTGALPVTNCKPSLVFEASRRSLSISETA